MAKQRKQSEPAPSIFDEPKPEETPQDKLKREAKQRHAERVAKNGEYNPWGYAKDKHGNPLD